MQRRRQLSGVLCISFVPIMSTTTILCIDVLQQKKCLPDYYYQLRLAKSTLN